MRYFPVALLILASVLAMCPAGTGQEPSSCSPACGSAGGGPKGLKWTATCFSRCGCPDDYCPHPLPQQCWPPYPCFYRCVPAGSRCPQTNCETKKDGWAVWFLPTPRTLKDAIWCQP
jgi:hypothetical protein